MTMKRHPAQCTVLPVTDYCHCGGKFDQTPHRVLPVTHPECMDCGSIPVDIRIRKTVDGHCFEFRYDNKNRRIRTLDDAHRVSAQIANEIAAGTFSRLHYKPKRGFISITSTISEFLRENIFTRLNELPVTEEDKYWIEEWMEPSIGDVGVFALSEIHLVKFIRFWNFKGEDRERAERLFNVVKQEIKL